MWQEAWIVLAHTNCCLERLHGLDAGMWGCTFMLLTVTVRSRSNLRGSCAWLLAALFLRREMAMMRSLRV